MALPELPAQGTTPWYIPRTNWDNAVETELEGRLSEAQLSDTIGAVGVVRNAGVTPDPAGDVGSAIAAAIAATPAGGTARVNPGNYGVTSTIIDVDKDVTIDLRGVRFLNRTSGASPAIHIRGGFDTPFPVSVLEVVDIPGGSAEWFGSASKGVKLTVSGTPTWLRGDVVKVYSDDYIRGQRGYEQPGWDAVTDKTRYGQFMVVHSVSAGEVILVGILREVEFYTTNIRVAKIVDHRVSVIGLGADLPLGPASTRRALMLDSLRSPLVEAPNIVRSEGAAITMRSCYGYTINTPQIGLTRDYEPANSFGYGIIDMASDSGVVMGGVIEHVRHAFTTDSERIPTASTDPADYGRSFGGKIVGTTSRSTASSGFDTHLDADSFSFIGCTVDMAWSGAGFNLRGIRHQVIGGHVSGCNHAFGFQGEGGSGGWSWGHKVSGVSVDNVERVFNNDVNQTGTAGAGTLETRINTISDITARNVRSKLGYVQNASLRLRNITADFSAASGTGILQMTGATGDVRATNLNLRFGAVAVVGTVFSVPAGPTVIVDGFDLEWTGTAPLSLANFSGTGNKLEAGRLAADLGSVASTGNIISWVGRSASASSRSSAISLVNSAITQSNITPVVLDPTGGFVRCQVTGADWTLTALPNGRFLGQRLVIWNRYASSNNLTLTNGSGANTLLIGASDKVLAPGQKIELVWVAEFDWLQMNPVA